LSGIPKPYRGLIYLKKTIMRIIISKEDDSIVARYTSIYPKTDKKLIYQATWSPGTQEWFHGPAEEVDTQIQYTQPRSRDKNLEVGTLIQIVIDIVKEFEHLDQTITITNDVIPFLLSNKNE